MRYGTGSTTQRRPSTRLNTSKTIGFDNACRQVWPTCVIEYLPEHLRAVPGRFSSPAATVDMSALNRYFGDAVTRVILRALWDGRL